MDFNYCSIIIIIFILRIHKFVLRIIKLKLKLRTEKQNREKRTIFVDNFKKSTNTFLIFLFFDKLDNNFKKKIESLK